MKRFSTPKPDVRAPSPGETKEFRLDIAAHRELVQRIYYKRFSLRVQAAGVESEDGLQLVYEGLLRKSQSERSRWNPSRGSLSTWVYVAMSCLVMDLAAKEERHTRAQPGRMRDVATWTLTQPTPW